MQQGSTNSTSGEKFEDPAHRNAIGLEQVLGDKTWWMLYIAAQDWNDAGMCPSGRENYYEFKQVNGHAASPGYRKAMIDVYSTCLVTKAEADRRSKTLTPEEVKSLAELKKLPELLGTNTPITWTLYLQLWKKLIPAGLKEKGDFMCDVNNEKKAHLSDEETYAPRVLNPGAESPAMDLNTAWPELPYLFAEDVLVPANFDINAAQAKSQKELGRNAYIKYCPTIKDFEGKEQSWMFDRTTTKMTNAKRLIDQIFLEFSRRMENARTRGAQLGAIAFAIRTLHLAHTMPDGNGRLHVYTLLPAMLLSCGFGLPMDMLSQFPEETLACLFNGGFTIDQISKYLWLIQNYSQYNFKR